MPLLYFFLLLMIYPELRARQLREQEASARSRGVIPRSNVPKAQRVLGVSRGAERSKKLKRRSAVVAMASHVAEQLHLMEALHFLWEDYEVSPGLTRPPNNPLPHSYSCADAALCCVSILRVP